MLANCTWFSSTSETSSYEVIIGTHIKWLKRLSLVICEGSVRKANKSEPIKTLPRCQQNSHNNCRCCQKVQNCPNMAILRTKTCSFSVLCHFWVWGRGALKIYLKLPLPSLCIDKRQVALLYLSVFIR